MALNSTPPPPVGVGVFQMTCIKSVSDCYRPNRFLSGRYRFEQNAVKLGERLFVEIMYGNLDTAVHGLVITGHRLFYTAVSSPQLYPTTTAKCDRK